VQQELRLLRLPNRLHRAYVVDVRVRVDYPRHVKFMPVGGGQNTFRLRAGIDYHRLLCFLAPNHVCVLRKRAYFQHLDYHFCSSDSNSDL